MEAWQSVHNIIFGLKALAKQYDKDSDTSWLDDSKVDREVKDLSMRISTELNSINKEARQGTFVFPMFFSSNLKPELVTQIAMAMESKYATLVKLYLDNIGSVDFGAGGTKRTFLGQAKQLLVEDHVETLDEGFNDLNMKDIEGSILHEAKNNNHNSDRNGMKEFNRGKTDYITGGASANFADRKSPYKIEPKLLDVKVVGHTGAGGAVKEFKLTIGVKVVPREVPSESILKNFSKARFDENFWVRLARTVTGEKKFFRDFVLRVDDFKKNKPSADKWFQELKNETRRAKEFTKIDGKRRMANTTFVLTLDEAEEMRRESNFDLIGKESTALRTMDALGIINLLIVDEAREKILLISDSTRKWEVGTFDQYKKESKGMSEKDVINLLLTSQGAR